MKRMSLGILAHVDAGKTTTERRFALSSWKSTAIG